MAWVHPKSMAASLLLLLLLCSATAATTPAPPQHPDPPGALTQLRAAAAGYLDQVGSVAGDLLVRLSLPSAQEKIRDAYEKGSTAVMTYTGILTDQLYHWWQGEQ
ncbi:apolipoprotein C-II [Grus americana]|uniref:apolipoprotein C-II n=1 Tax=Grus americana TaxID=9117 RepID=UPI0024087365|nr:apolipoprotein C-II [Grus americana]